MMDSKFGLWLGVAAIVVSGCGSDVTAPERTGTPMSAPANVPSMVRAWDCSDLLTEEDVERIVGRADVTIVSAVRGDDDPDQPGRTACGYHVPPAGGLNFVINTGPALTPGGGDEIREIGQHRGIEYLSDIGDEAWVWQPARDSASAVAIGKGVEIHVGVGNERGQEKVISERVLRTVAEKIGL